MRAYACSAVHMPSPRTTTRPPQVSGKSHCSSAASKVVDENCNDTSSPVRHV
jgi:hypothetical protein